MCVKFIVAIITLDVEAFSMKLPVRHFVFCKRRLTAAPEQTHMLCIVKGMDGIQ